jgi:hypothetical protein
MDFIDWCHHVLQTLERERFHAHLGDHELQNILFGESAQQPGFHTSDARHGMFHALKALSNAGLAQEDRHKWRITPLGREVLADPTNYWTAICEQELDPEEEHLLLLACQLSSKQGVNPDHAWLEDVGRDPILAAFNIPPPPPKTNEHMDDLQKYLYDLPNLLADRNFLMTDGRAGYHNDITPTYQGLVWGTRRGFTIESKFIDELVREWETTNVDFKREIGLDTKKQKAEFAKDVLGLATTKSSGRRYMIVGFDDKTRAYYAPPDGTVTQNRMEQILADLTDPVVSIRYEIVDYRLGKVGKLEVIREPEKLPYRAAKDVFDDAGKKRLEKGKVYVRHGSQTEAPTTAELAALEDEGLRAHS